MVAPTTPLPPMFFALVFVALIVTSAEQLSATMTLLQFITDSVLPGAVADAVMTSFAIRPETPDSVQAPELTVVVFNTVPFL